MNFGEILKELRLSRGEKQIDIARVVKVSDRTVGLWERNENLPSIETVKALANHFDVSVDFLIGRADTSVLDRTDPNMLSSKDERYLLLGRILKKSSKEEQEKFYKMAELMLSKHPNERLFADAAEVEDDDTI